MPAPGRDQRRKRIRALASAQKSVAQLCGLGLLRRLPQAEDALAENPSPPRRDQQRPCQNPARSSSASPKNTAAQHERQIERRHNEAGSGEATERHASTRTR